MTSSLPGFGGAAGDDLHLGPELRSAVGARRGSCTFVTPSAPTFSIARDDDDLAGADAACPARRASRRGAARISVTSASRCRSPSSASLPLRRTIAMSGSPETPSVLLDAVRRASAPTRGRRRRARCRTAVASGRGLPDREAADVVRDRDHALPDPPERVDDTRAARRARPG